MTEIDEEQLQRTRINARIKAMRKNGSPDWFIRKVLVEKGFPKAEVKSILEEGYEFKA